MEPAGIGHNRQHRQTVYRTHGNRAHTAILNSFLQDGRISHETKGLIAEMLSYPSDWDFTVSYMVKNSKSGRDKVYRMLKEAEAHGYVIPFQYRALDGKIQKQTYLVSDDPEALIKAVAEEIHELEKLDADDPLPENPEVAKSVSTNPLPEKPDTGIQEVDPLPEKPDPAKPFPVNPHTTNNIYNKKTQDKESPDGDLFTGGLGAYSEPFETFWKSYPRRVGKGAAYRAWKRLKGSERQKAQVGLIAQLGDLTAKMNDPKGNFCPHAATWIGQRRFDDEPTNGGGLSDADAMIAKHQRTYRGVL